MSAATIYTNPRAWRVRIAQAAVWGFGAIIVWLAFFSNGAAGGEAERVFIWIVGALMAALMALTPLYLRAYVTAIETAPGGWRVTTLAAFGRRSFIIDPRGASLGETRHDQSSLRIVVNNFWASLRAPGEALPLILDLTPPASLDERALRP